MNPWYKKLLGTVSQYFQIGGPPGPRLKNNAGNINARNSTDTAYINLRVADPLIGVDAVNLEFLQANYPTDIDLLLTDPPDWLTNTYAVTFNGNRVASETWTTTYLLKRINYSFSGSHISQEVRYVYAPDGITVIGQVTINYTFSGSRIASAVTVRNI